MRHAYQVSRNSDVWMCAETLNGKHEESGQTEGNGSTAAVDNGEEDDKEDDKDDSAAASGKKKKKKGKGEV